MWTRANDKSRPLHHTQLEYEETCLLKLARREMEMEMRRPKSDWCEGTDHWTTFLPISWFDWTLCGCFPTINMFPFLKLTLRFTKQDDILVFFKFNHNCLESKKLFKHVSSVVKSSQHPNVIHCNYCCLNIDKYSSHNTEEALHVGIIYIQIVWHDLFDINRVERVQTFRKTWLLKNHYCYDPKLIFWCSAASGIKCKESTVVLFWCDC